MTEERSTVRPSLRAFFSNWKKSDLPFLVRLRVALRNNWVKFRSRQNCCGNVGQPGC